MAFFITCLRALAACLITNSHYTGVYPTDLIANGGLLGDVVFFAVSGYCLSRIRLPFHKWYGKRVVRCYLPVLIATAVYMLLGAYKLEQGNLFYWFVYPTCYHFVASIIVLYIPYYVVMSVPALRNRIPLVMALTAAAYGAVYVFGYDAGYYHIDNVREPMIWFLYFESMMLGSWFRHHDSRLRGRFSWGVAAAAAVTFVLYFASKICFARGIFDSGLQAVNQLILLALLYFLFRLFMGLDNRLRSLPERVRKGIAFIADMTLEIYVVQYVIIDYGRSLVGFPWNWLLLTGSILLSAWLLHRLCGWLVKGFGALGKHGKTEEN